LAVRGFAGDQPGDVAAAGHERPSGAGVAVVRFGQCLGDVA